MNRVKWTLIGLVLTAAMAGCGPSGDEPPPSVREPGDALPTPSGTLAAPDQEAYGNIIYVSAYSHIYHIRQGKDFQLTVTLSVRNPFPWRSVTITRVDYFDSSGNFVRSYLDQPRQLSPLETLAFVVAQDDKSGGSGANFLVGWEGEEGEAGPVAEAVMIGTASGQGLSFMTTGRAIHRD